MSLWFLPFYLNQFLIFSRSGSAITRDAEKRCLIGIFWSIYWWKSVLVTYHTKVRVWTGKLCLLFFLIFCLYSFMRLSYNSESHWLLGDLVLGVEIVFPSQIFTWWFSWNLVDFYLTNMLLFALQFLVRWFINQKR